MNKVELFEFTEDELDIILYIIGDWQRLKSDLGEGVVYPNFSTTSTKLFRLFNAIVKKMRE